MMGNFQSDFQTATSMKNAADTIQSTTNRSITKASRTTLSVNAQAKETNQQMKDLTRRFCGTFLQAVDNIHSAAKEFERMDNELQKTFH
ncbi:TIGR04197 family type VII secretion effector [Bacillus wiedmannii]|nr:TIGR04197 family type VII secretion effector [Bacillus wiedmannii]PGC14666.1 TIGR04197 family type VII secretion effector [Bacillus wiedmannii]PGC49442.1 TIGR04197 family type VII secretion effector [Bacillus wiedmannii]